MCMLACVCGRAEVMRLKFARGSMSESILDATVSIFRPALLLLVLSRFERLEFALRLAGALHAVVHADFWVCDEVVGDSWPAFVAVQLVIHVFCQSVQLGKTRPGHSEGKKTDTD